MPHLETICCGYKNIFRIDDMLAILFPHMFEDVEFLLPPDEDVHMEDGVEQANAVAGPSKLT